MKLSFVVVKVRGSGQFPIDMLRHDNLTPYSEDDSYSIISEAGAYRTITLQGWYHGKGTGPSRIDVARWQSFGWWVYEIAIDGKVLLDRNLEE